MTGGRRKSEMSGARLCSLVAELGYEGTGKLDPGSFEWPFQYDDARPILDWICFLSSPLQCPLPLRTLPVYAIYSTNMGYGEAMRESLGKRLEGFGDSSGLVLAINGEGPSAVLKCVSGQIDNISGESEYFPVRNVKLLMSFVVDIV